ncbi:efflux RND transporter permease subunit [Motiliproteus sediminis]|uniref:efflux RND transporter permease subunit n=1 Tax=Motiliproteus sediminis TaxID=1468178 RepID=UPI001AEF3EAD|nr:efflux RND transporter permease subunit [Motiliproteus sediminis]
MNNPSQAPLKNSLIAVFARHRVAANLLMFLIVLAGSWGLKKLNTQFFPSFELDIITIAVPWRGAAAEDIERSVIIPIELELKGVNGIKETHSTANLGLASIRLELEESVDTGEVLDEVKQKIDSLRTLPSDAEEPVVKRIIRYEAIASLIVSGRGTLEELRPLVRQLERDLLSRGVRRVEINGLPEKEIAIQVPNQALHDLGMTLGQIATTIEGRSQDLPAGTAGSEDGARQLRSLGQQRSAGGYQQLPLITQADGRLIRVGDVATVVERPRDHQSYLEYDRRPAVELTLQRTENDDTLAAARLLDEWLTEVRPTLPEGVEIVVYNELWHLLRDRIQLLLKNGLGGLILVIATLFLFLNVRVAFWVTAGIPISFLAALAVLYLIGGSINMISLFGMIMALGIIVDDAIVVGEDTLTHVQQGEPGMQSAIGGAHRMLAPVIASSLTTISAFLPLTMVGGIIGNILIDIPTVVICVIIASLVECFLILPGHLHHSFARAEDARPGRLRSAIDRRFNHLRDHQFRRLVGRAIRFRWVTLSAALAMMMIALALTKSGRVPFTFFPVVDGDVLTASVQFTAGTPHRRVDAFLDHLEDALYAAEKELGVELSTVVVQHQRRALFTRDALISNQGDEYGSVVVQLVRGDLRPVSNDTLLRQWRSQIVEPAGIERLSITQQTGGPPGKPIEIKLTRGNVETLKAASLELQARLKSFDGVSNVDDDLPFGTEQWIYELTATGNALGLDLASVGGRLRAAFDGELVQIFHRNEDEIEVRVMLPDAERDHLAGLENLPILLPGGSTAPLSNLVEFKARRGIDTLKRVDGELALMVSADVDDKIANANQIIDELQNGTLREIRNRYGISASFEGKKADERETLADMLLGLGLALALIFIILAWVFSSYLWPLTVMAAIPLGLTGAILGHWLMGLNLTILSLFGLFGLSGIVINDSIVLLSFYRKLRDQGIEPEAAIIDAACQRLRAVLLTSLTTIAGLSPILFETSLQAQFLIPMATSMVFGLAYGTALILLLVPALLIMLENLKRLLGIGRVGHVTTQNSPS